MKERQLHETIQELRAELENTPSIDARVRARIQSVLNEIEALIEEHGEIPSHRHQQFLERLRESARHFEESPLPLTLAVGRVIDALSGIGI